MYSPSFPALVFMKFAWSDRGRAEYDKASQRTRYMACDYLANRPPYYTPLTCFQVASHKKYPLYWTTHESYVIIKTKKCVYIMTSAQLRTIAGDWPPRKRNPSDADRTFQVNTFPKLWDDDPSSSVWVNFSPYRCTDLTELYLMIIRHCQSAALTSGDVYQMLPRPVNPQPRLPLGLVPAIPVGSTTPELGHDTPQLAVRAAPKHRRGERKKPRDSDPVG
jgi:hypothetical protein